MSSRRGQGRRLPGETVNARSEATKTHVAAAGLSVWPTISRRWMASLRSQCRLRLVAGCFEVQTMKFALDPRLASDTCEIGDLGLSRALLMNDARYPWVILAPRRQGAVEISDLTS